MESSSPEPDSDAPSRAEQALRAALTSETSDLPDVSGQAPREALARARAAAKERGLRPGMKPRPRPGASPDGRAAPARSRSGDPQLIGFEAESMIHERGWAHEVAVGSVTARWPQLCGPDIAAHSVPVAFAEGVLTIQADSTAWATQMRLLTSTLLARFAAEIGEGIVTSIVVSGPHSPSWGRGPGRIHVRDGRGPRDTYG